MSYHPYDRNPSGVIFFGTNSTDQVYESNDNFVYDSGNNRLGIDIAAPSGTLHVVGEAYVDNLKLDGNTLSATNTNGALILNPNGTGALQADSGGNTRGAYAVDLQRKRAFACQVASGPYSTIGGGNGNTTCASACGSTISGGYYNQVSGGYQSTVGGGYGNCASCSYATIGGGYGNCASCSYATIGGGYGNCVTTQSSTIGGGYTNIASGTHSTVGGGKGNCAIGDGSTVSGGGNYFGTGNTACGNWSTISGGYRNFAIANYSTVGGGYSNCASGACSFVGGGYLNTASGYCSTVSGGKCNCACGHYSKVGGGINNTASGSGSKVGGGLYNHASGFTSTISGGCVNTASGGCSTVSGGCNNDACGDNSTVGGGNFNRAIGDNSTVSGGYTNCASGSFSTISGGYTNYATGACSTISGGYFNCTSGNDSTVSGGRYNRACGDYSIVSGGYCNTASANYSTVIGGYNNIASGIYSLVGGYCNLSCHTNAHIIGSGITSSAADTLYTNKICANNTITGTSIIKSGGTSSQFLKADGSVDSTAYTTCVGTVTSVSAGNGMNFTTISSSGPVTLGTPGDVTLSSTSSVSTNSHTHAFTPGGTTAQYIRGDGSLDTFPTNIAIGTGVANHIAFWTGSSTISYDSNQLYWDSTNDRLGVGTNNPSYDLDIAGSGRFTGNLSVNGDLIINGTTTTVNSTVVTIEDPILVLGSGTPTVDDNKDRGIAFNYFDGSAKQGFFGYDDNEQKFTFFTDATIAGEVVSGTVGTIKADLNGNADTATDADGLSSSVTVQLSNQLSGSSTFQDGGDTCNISASLTADAITDQTQISTVSGDDDLLLIWDSGVGLRSVTPQNLIDDLNIVTSFNVSDGTTSVQVDQGETISFADGTGAEFVVTNVGGQPTVTVNSVDSEIVHDNLSGFVSGEHINHTSVTLTAGDGLSGGGDISASRTFAIDISEYSTTGVGAGDSFLMLDSDGSTEQRSTITQVGAYMAGTNITNTNGVLSVPNSTIETAVFTSANFVDSSRIDFTVTAGDSLTADVKTNSISETYLTASVAGAGLTGGNGTPLAVGEGSLIDVAADSISVDLTEAAVAAIANGDYLIFLDGGATGAASKGSTADLATLMAGEGLVTDGSELDVNVDDSTIEVASDVVQVKDGGITEVKITRTVDASLANNDTITEDINLVAGGPGGIQIKLPSPASGKIVYVKKTDNAVGAVTVLPNNTETIDGASQKILYSQYESLSFVADGTDWFII